MRSFLSFFLISSGWLLALSTGASAAAQPPIIYPAQATNLDIRAFGLLACGGGGSGSYRKPPRPGHGNHENSSNPAKTTTNQQANLIEKDMGQVQP